MTSEIIELKILLPLFDVLVTSDQLTLSEIIELNIFFPLFDVLVTSDKWKVTSLPGSGGDGLQVMFFRKILLRNRIYSYEHVAGMHRQAQHMCKMQNLKCKSTPSIT